eukprot:1824812-Amphidinium_carterae.1
MGPFHVLMGGLPNGPLPEAVAAARGPYPCLLLFLCVMLSSIPFLSMMVPLHLAGYNTVTT